MKQLLTVLCILSLLSCSKEKRAEHPLQFGKHFIERIQWNGTNFYAEESGTLSYLEYGPDSSYIYVESEAYPLGVYVGVQIKKVGIDFQEKQGEKLRHQYSLQFDDVPAKSIYGTYSFKKLSADTYFFANTETTRTPRLVTGDMAYNNQYGIYFSTTVHTEKARQ